MLDQAATVKTGVDRSAADVVDAVRLLRARLSPLVQKIDKDGLYPER